MGLDWELEWLRWAKRLQAISQDGLTYTKDRYDVERYELLREIAAEIMSRHSDADQRYVSGLFAAELGPATPKVDVRAAVFRANELMLVKEPDDGGWSLPGGWADVGESPSEAVVREVYEESGYRTHARKVLAVYDRDRQGHPPYPYHVYKIVLRCELTGEGPSPNAETEARFFGEGAIPKLSLTRVMPAQIPSLFRHLRDPGLPADFD